MTDDTLRHTIQQLALRDVYWSRPAPVIVPKADGHRAFYTFVAQHIGPSRSIDYLEFGVAHGDSLRLMAELFNNSATTLYGFDSFIGLPEAWAMHKVGAFSRGGEPPRIDDERVQFVKGWFQNTVPEFFRLFKPTRDRPVLIHIDSDLYSSALFLLTFLWTVVDDYYFVFDDFIYDEVVALGNFLEAFPVDLQFLAQTKGGGERPNPDQVFGHMRRKLFELSTTGA